MFVIASICAIVIGFIIMSQDKLVYEDTLPDEPSGQWLDFFRSKLFYDKNILSGNHEEGFIFEEEMIIDPKKKVSYSFSPTTKLYHYYFDRLSSEEERKYAYREVNPNAYLEVISKPEKYHLPDITLQNDRIIIQTKEAEKEWTSFTFENKEIKMDNVRAISVMGMDENFFYISITLDSIDNNVKYLLFMSQDLTDYKVTTEKEFETFVQTDTFQKYQNLFPAIDDSNVYLNSFDKQQVIDTNNRQLITIDSSDYLSEDGKYVYLDGSNRVTSDEILEEGTQYIQTLENYLRGNDEYVLTFELNYKDISKASDIGGFGTKFSDNSSGIVYFKDEMIVLHAKYDAAFFGIAGDTNVVIDFSKNKDDPTVYVVDLAAS